MLSVVQMFLTFVATASAFAPTGMAVRAAPKLVRPAVAMSAPLVEVSLRKCTLIADTTTCRFGWGFSLCRGIPQSPHLHAYYLLCCCQPPSSLRCPNPLLALAPAAAHTAEHTGSNMGYRPEGDERGAGQESPGRAHPADIALQSGRLDAR